MYIEEGNRITEFLSGSFPGYLIVTVRGKEVTMKVFEGLGKNLYEEHNFSTKEKERHPSSLKKRSGLMKKKDK